MSDRFGSLRKIISGGQTGADRAPLELRLSTTFYRAAGSEAGRLKTGLLKQDTYDRDAQFQLPPANAVAAQAT